MSSISPVDNVDNFLITLFMFKITIITLGKIKDSWWKEAENEYRKRLSSLSKIQYIELREEPFHDNDPHEIIKKKEAEKLLKKIPENAFLIALHEQGKEMNSKTFANFLEKQSEKGQEIVFIIGGPLGLHKTILDIVHLQISLSQLTFPHQMVRPILIEQIYRASTILQNKNYHY